MAEITITSRTPHRAHVTGIASRTQKVVDDACSYKIEGSFFMRRATGIKGWDGKKHLFSKVTGGFPIGLLERVKDALKKKGTPFKVIDERKFKRFLPVNPKYLKDITLAKHQIDAVNAVLKSKLGILHLATNAGKTECGIAVVKVIDGITLWVVPGRLLLNQTRERIASRLGVPVKEIGMIGNGKFEPAKITVAITASLTVKRGKSAEIIYKAKRKRLGDYLKSVQVLVADEVHHSGSTSYWRPLSSCPALYRIGLSGTPLDRMDNANLLVEGLCGPVIARVTNQDLVDIDWSAKPTIEVHDINVPDLTDVGLWQEAYKQGIVDNAVRNEMIVKRVLLALKAGEPTLVLCREIAHIENLAHSFEVRGVKVSVAHATLPPEKIAKALKLFVSGKRDILIGSPMLGEGFDMPGDRIMVYVNAEALMSTIRTLQKFGRSARKKKDGPNKVRVIEFADFHNRHLAKHALKRIELYESEGFKILPGSL